MADLYEIALEKCPYQQLRAALVEFPFEVPEDDDWHTNMSLEQAEREE